jgi:hypothetical protein
MPKHVIRIPPLKAGHSVAWTFEVSAAGDAERGARAKKTRKKRQARQQAVKGTRMARVRREPDVVNEWAASSEASPAMPTPETARAMEPAPAIEAPAIEVAAIEVAAIEVPPAIDVTPAMPATAPASPVAVPLAAAVVAPRPAVRVRQRRLRPIALIAASVGVVAALAFPRRPLAPGVDGAAGSLPASPKQAAELVAPTSGPVATSTAAPADAESVPASHAASVSPKKPLAARPEKNHAAVSTTSAARLTAVKPVATISLKDAEAKLPAAEPVAPLTPASSSTTIAGSTPVTITGCLEVSVDHDEFRLTDTDGAAAPKSRSWRTGFLKKRSAPVALIAPPDAMALQTHVGHRVSATGVLTSHDLKVSTLRVVGPACN